jgi:hypothetical protein
MKGYFWIEYVVVDTGEYCDIVVSELRERKKKVARIMCGCSRAPSKLYEYLQNESNKGFDGNVN